MKSSNDLFLFSLIVFLINPLLSIIVLLLYGISLRSVSVQYKREYLFLFGILCCVFISIVNMSKVPDNDLAEYIYKYKIADQYSLINYLLVAPEGVIETYKEPLFHTLVWFMNRIFGGNVSAYLFTMSMLQYSLLIFSLILLGEKLNLRLYVIVTGIILLCFIPYIFTHTMHLIRQTLANSILCYIMVKHFFCNKREWLVMGAMVLIHSSSALFLPTLLIPAFGRNFKDAWCWYAGAFALLVGIQIVSGYLLGIGLMGDGSTISYALNRATENSIGGDRYLITKSVILLIGIMLVFAVLVHMGKLVPASEGLRRYTFVFIFVSVFILINSQQGLWAARFSHYWFTLLPSFLMILFQARKTSNFIQFLISLGVVLFWSVYLYKGEWSYNIPLGPWISPVICYIL